MFGFQTIEQALEMLGYMILFALISAPEMIGALMEYFVTWPVLLIIQPLVAYGFYTDTFTERTIFSN